MERSPSTPTRRQDAPSSGSRRSTRNRRAGKFIHSPIFSAPLALNLLLQAVHRPPAVGKEVKILLELRALLDAPRPPLPTILLRPQILAQRASTPVFTPHGRRSTGNNRNRVGNPSPPPPEIIQPEPLYSEAESVDFPEAIEGEVKIGHWTSPVKVERKRREREQREKDAARRRNRRRSPAPGQEVFDLDGNPYPPSTPASRSHTKVVPGEIIDISSDDEELTPTRPRPQKRKRRPSKPVPAESVIDLATTTAEEDNGPAPGPPFSTNDEQPSPTRRSPLKRKRCANNGQLSPRKRARAASVEVEMSSAEELQEGDRPGTPPVTDVDVEDFMVEDLAPDETGPVVPDRTEDETRTVEPQREAELPCEPGQRDVPPVAENSNVVSTQDHPPEHLADRLLNERLFDEALALIAQDAPGPPPDETPAMHSAASSGAASGEASAPPGVLSSPPPITPAPLAFPIRAPTRPSPTPPRASTSSAAPSSHLAVSPYFATPPTSELARPARQGPSERQPAARASPISAAPRPSPPTLPHASSPPTHASPPPNPISTPSSQPPAPSSSAPPPISRPVARAEPEWDFYHRQLVAMQSRGVPVLRPAIRTPAAAVKAKKTNERVAERAGGGSVRVKKEERATELAQLRSEPAPVRTQMRGNDSVPSPLRPAEQPPPETRRNPTLEVEADAPLPPAPSTAPPPPPRQEPPETLHNPTVGVDVSIPDTPLPSAPHNTVPPHSVEQPLAETMPNSSVAVEVRMTDAPLPPAPQNTNPSPPPPPPQEPPETLPNSTVEVNVRLADAQLHLVPSITSPSPPPRPEAQKPPETAPTSTSQVPAGYTPPLSPGSDSTLGASPPTIFTVPGDGAVKQVAAEELSDDDDFGDMELQYLP
ncbi:hypothetical protein FB451DRAFT_1488938 [Mycena latifolia]|nr:hypothetical protein FB451DRAFT_1488938 [Mycena latifolia]